MNIKYLFMAVLAFCVMAAPASAQNVSNYMEQGGARWVVGGSLDVASGGDLDIESGGSLKLGGTALATEPLANPGRGSFAICGEATTVNNNTVYYGPDITFSSAGNGGLTCNVDATGNTTEATADAPVYTSQAVHVVGMTCRNEGDANASISYTLRTAAGATVPSVTCTIADNARDCVADIQTTTAIAAGATVAVAASSTSNVGDNNGFVCDVAVAF